jgi:hypothetical protein
MISIGFVIAVSLATILTFSGITKLFNRDGFSSALVGTFGLPKALGQPMSLAVPVFELMIAAGLLIEPLVIASLIAATLFFSAALIVAGLAFVSGRSGDCGCFGDLVEDELGRKTLARLGALIGLSALGIAVFTPTVRGDLWLPAFLEPVFAALGVGLAVLGVIAARRAARVMA